MNWGLSHETFAIQGMELKKALLLAPGYGTICPVNGEYITGLGQTIKTWRPENCPFKFCKI